MMDQVKDCKIEVPETIDTVKQVYGWAASNVGESIGEADNDKFFNTFAYTSLLYRIQNAKKGLTMIEGLQGTGKSRNLLELSKDVKDNIRIKWIRNWKEELWQQDERLSIRYYELLEKEFADQIEGLKASGRNTKLRRIGNAETYAERNDHRSMEEIIGKSRSKTLREQAFNDFLGSIRVFLVDMQDYLRSNAAAMNNDIALIQEFYQSLSTKDTTHLVIAAQKELIMNSDHFFWGKFTRYTIEPLPPYHLIQAYQLNNPDTEVFDKDALNYLSIVSRGVFRRFKKYICLAIEAHQQQTKPINEAQARMAITSDVIFKDLNEELSNLFDQPERKSAASTILNYLRDHKKTNIKTLSKETGTSESMAQKIVAKLELYNYVTIQSGSGKEKLVSLCPYMPVQRLSIYDMPYEIGDDKLSPDELQKKREMWLFKQNVAALVEENNMFLLFFGNINFTTLPAKEITEHD